MAPIKAMKAKVMKLSLGKVKAKAKASTATKALEKAKLKKSLGNAKQNEFEGEN